jgi:hypothetical protein
MPITKEKRLTGKQQDITRIIQEFKQCFIGALWHRGLKTAKKALNNLLRVKWIYIKKELGWLRKAVRLIKWLELPENVELLVRVRKIKPQDGGSREYQEWRISVLNRDNWQC